MGEVAGVRDVYLDLVFKLGSVDWVRYGVIYAVLFGSALHSECFRDVDIAVLFDGVPEPERVLGLINHVADVLGVSDDRVDVAVLNSDDVSCVLVEEALGKGRLVFCRDWGFCIDDIIRRLKLCWDFELSYRKLNLLKTAIEVVEGSWGS